MKKRIKMVKALPALFDFFSSARLAVFVLSILLLVCIIGTIIPQSGDIPSAQLEHWQADHCFWAKIFDIFGCFDIFNSNIFFLILSVLSLNLLLCTLKMCINEKRFFFFPFSPHGFIYWGFLIIHFSLLLMAGAIIVNQGFGATGKFVVKENMQFRGGNLYLYFRHGLFCDPKSPYPLLDFTVFFKKLTVDYEGKVATKRSFEVEIKDKEKKVVANIAVNEPLIYGGYTFTMDEYGFAPHIIVKDGEKGKVISSLPGLLYPPGKTAQGKENIFYLPDNLKLKIDFFPDAVEINSREFKLKNGGYELKNPVFVFTLWQGKNLLGRNLLHYHPSSRKPVSIHIGNYIIGVAKIEYWCAFAISRSPALFLVYFSMWLCLFGLLVRYFKTVFYHENT